MLHQNRVNRGSKNYVPEQIVPENICLVLCGYEHNCRIHPERVPGCNYMVTQHGSSLTTSLSESESYEKYIAVVSIVGNEL